SDLDPFTGANLLGGWHGREPRRQRKPGAALAVQPAVPLLGEGREQVPLVRRERGPGGRRAGSLRHGAATAGDRRREDRDEEQRGDQAAGRQGGAHRPVLRRYTPKPLSA